MCIIILKKNCNEKKKKELEHDKNKRENNLTITSK